MRMFKVVALVAALSGCSVAFQSKPKAGMTSAQSGCSTTHAWWIADAVIAAVGAVGVGYAISQAGDEHAAIGPGALALGFGFMVSADKGYEWRKRCEADSPAQTARR